MKCRYCNGTGKYQQPKDIERFNHIVDTEMEKAYFVNYDTAENKAYKDVGFDLIECSYYNNTVKGSDSND